MEVRLSFSHCYVSMENYFPFQFLRDDSFVICDFNILLLPGKRAGSKIGSNMNRATNKIKIHRLSKHDYKFILYVARLIYSRLEMNYSTIIILFLFLFTLLRHILSYICICIYHKLQYCTILYFGT